MKELIGFKKGINLGGWLSQGSLDKKHLDTFIVEDDIRRIAEMKVDHIRLPLDYENIEDEDGNVIEAGYQYIENCIKWCQKYHLNLVLDLHKTVGYIFDQESDEGFFDSEELQNRFYTIWDRLSKRFAKYSDMMMFELLNEVTKYEYKDKWNVIAKKCIQIIRKNAPKIKILYGGIWNNSVDGVLFLEKPYDENIVYNCHCYEPLLFTHQKAYWVKDMPKDFTIDYPGKQKDYEAAVKIVPIANTECFRREIIEKKNDFSPAFFESIFKPAVEYAEKMDVSLYVGEYGTIDQADPRASMRWLKDINACFEKFGLGRCLWTYKEKDFGLIGEHYKEIYDEMIKYL